MAAGEKGNEGDDFVDGDDAGKGKEGRRRREEHGE